MSNKVEILDLDELEAFIRRLEQYESDLDTMHKTLSKEIDDAEEWWRDDMYKDFREAWTGSSKNVRYFLNEMPTYIIYLHGVARDLRDLLRRRL